MSTTYLTSPIPVPVIDKEMKDYTSNIAIPPGSLGRIIELAQHTYKVTKLTKLNPNQIVCMVYAADHGIANNSISAFPKSATFLNVLHMLNDKAAVNQMCMSIGCRLEIVDIGICDGNTQYQKPRNVKTLFWNKGWKQGTNDSSLEPAMDQGDMEKCFSISTELIQRSKEVKVVVLGEMGIGNSSTSSILQALIQDINVKECIGRGSGINDEILAKKLKVCEETVNRVRALYPNGLDVFDICREVGGFEILAMAGSIIKAAQLHKLIVIDGYMACVSALIAYRINPHVKPFLVFATKSTELGQMKILKELNVEPYLDFQMRLGEGTGALSLVPVIRLSMSILSGMASLDSLKGSMNSN